MRHGKVMHNRNLNAPANNGAVTSSFPFGPHYSSVGFTALTLVSIFFFFCFISFHICRCVQQRSSTSTAVDEHEYPYRHPPRPLTTVSEISTSQNTITTSNVGSIPTVPYNEDERHPVDCVICLSEFQIGEVVKAIPYCGHMFHPNCVDTWLVSHQTCPLCRSTRIYEEVQLPVTVTRDDPESSTAQDCEARGEAGVASGPNNAG